MICTGKNVPLIVGNANFKYILEQGGFKGYLSAVYISIGLPTINSPWGSYGTIIVKYTSFLLCIIFFLVLVLYGVL